jgi:hypothetical protein
MIDDLVARWREMIAVRKEAEDAISDLKKQEAIYEADILSYINELGHTGVKLSNGLGTITKSQRVSVRFGDDPELVCKSMFDEMSQALNDGRPLVNGLLLNKAAASTKLLDRARDILKTKGLEENPINLNDVLNPLGFYVEVKDVIHFASSRGAA